MVAIATLNCMPETWVSLILHCFHSNNMEQSYLAPYLVSTDWSQSQKVFIFLVSWGYKDSLRRTCQHYFVAR